MRCREVSPTAVVQACLDRIEEVNGAINAVVTLCADRALAEAKEAESAIAGDRAGRLAGLPFTVKDTIDTAGARTTAGSRPRADVVPSVDAPVVAQMRAEGAILLGKTNTPEFAMTYSTDNSLFGRTRNPWNLDLTVGGSSGGEAAIIAAGGSPLGLGSDLGGSIRVPAAFCRVVGLRPSIGRLPHDGHVPNLPDPLGRLSVIGPMARYVDDVDMLMSVLAPGWRGPRSAEDPEPHPPVVDTIGFYQEDGVVPVTPEVKDVVGSAADAFSGSKEVTRVTPPGVEELYELWDEIWEASGGPRGLLAVYVTEGADLSPTLERLIPASSGRRDEVRLKAAMRRVEELRRETLGFMEMYPVILCPVAAGPPTPRPGSWTVQGSEIRGARGFGYSYVWSLLGFPAIALPWPGYEDGPITAVQIVARPDQDEKAIAVARTLEQARARPPVLAPSRVNSIY